MVYFTRWALDTMSERIAQLGLSECGVCDSGHLTVGTQPALIHIGGISEPREPGDNILFMFRVRCSLCGHTMLFDSEAHSDGDTPVLHREHPDDQPPEADEEPGQGPPPSR